MLFLTLRTCDQRYRQRGPTPKNLRIGVEMRQGGQTCARARSPRVKNRRKPFEMKGDRGFGPNRIADATETISTRFFFPKQISTAISDTIARRIRPRLELFFDPLIT